jgi:Cu/Ag efflux pump CusA
VVDDAIIDVENIVRRLRANHALGSPLSAFTVVLSASVGVRSAVVFGSLIVVLVLLPVFMLPGCRRLSSRWRCRISPRSSLRWWWR